MFSRLAPYALMLALCASLAAILGFWLWWQAREENAALRAENRGLHEAARITSRFIEDQRARDTALLDAIGGLANVPDTTACADSPAMRRALDRLRDQ